MTARGKPSFTFGIEEEYFLVDPRTRALVSEPPKSMLDECRDKLGGHVSAEYQRSQIEVGLHARRRRP
jgi:glutamate---cysteine ligase / carboxylate-amine ligase